MDRNIAMERAWAADSWNVGEEPSPPLILVLLLSFGLCAAIWGAVILLLAAVGPW
jgi:hypothetical protein